MSNTFKIKSPLSTGASVDLDDTINTKEALRNLGYYKLPDYGLTPYPDQALFDGIKRVQRRYHPPETGEIRPGDATEGAVRFALAEKESIRTDGQKRDGKYIWRTRGDSKVRSEHAERNGKTYDWNNPPEGGHPGEAPNCRCRAENVADNREECQRLKAQLEVDSANLERARAKYDTEVQRVNEHLILLRKNRDQRDILWDKAIAEFGYIAVQVLTRRPDPTTPAGLAVIAVEYGGLELEYAELAERLEEMATDRKHALKDKDEAASARRATQEKFDQLNCSHQ